ncbi:uncharacterized protein LOC115904558 [Camarhynchus parvulus]|uniref:uncharacterized protein LOC115904558 n=1 Tax=Geospiza parvula TaxID=87175 RepID=UPI00123827BC|nr:uncharacterized protein LOC115904558 [Camarhynchus parvulus]
MRRRRRRGAPNGGGAGGPGWGDRAGERPQRPRSSAAGGRCVGPGSRDPRGAGGAPSSAFGASGRGAAARGWRAALARAEHFRNWSRGARKRRQVPLLAEPGPPPAPRCLRSRAARGSPPRSGPFPGRGRGTAPGRDPLYRERARSPRCRAPSGPLSAAAAGAGLPQGRSPRTLPVPGSPRDMRLCACERVGAPRLRKG